MTSDVYCGRKATYQTKQNLKFSDRCIWANSADLFHGVQRRMISVDNFFVFLRLLLAHLSRRLIGELIGYSWSGVRPSSFTMLKDLLRNRLADQSQILCGASLGRGNESLFAMAATPIYGNNPSKIFFSRTSGPIFTKLGM